MQQTPTLGEGHRRVLQGSPARRRNAKNSLCPADGAVICLSVCRNCRGTERTSLSSGATYRSLSGSRNIMVRSSSSGKPNLKVDPDALYTRLGYLIANAPNLAAHPTPPSTLEWLGGAPMR